MSTRKAIITGASSGIGEALAHALAAEGYDLGLAARRLERLDTLADTLRKQHGIHVHTAALDVAQDDTVAPILNELVRRLGGLDLLIANAGTVGVNRTGSGDISIDKQVIQTNLIGAIATVDAAAKVFRAQKHGHIVGISSFSAFHAIPGSGAYSGSKAALTNYLQAARIELKKHGIAVTTIHPGFIKTDLAPNMEKYPFVVQPAQAAKEILAAIRAKRADAIVPRMPWSLLKPALAVLPDSLVQRIF